MTDLPLLLSQLGPAFERRTLLEAGLTVHDIAVNVRLGTILRLRRAWYAAPGAPLDVKVAVSLGGRLGSISAARSYGLWTGTDRAIHVSWSPHGNVALPGRRLQYPLQKKAFGVEIVPHWTVLRTAAPPLDPSPWRESIEQTIAQVLSGCDRPTAVACVDSALHSGQVSHEQLRAICVQLPASVPGMHCFDVRTDSGIESIVRLWLLDHGIPFVFHPVIDGIGEVDFVIGDSLILETDGQAHHSDPATFEKDRRRDHAAALLGYVTARLSYRMVIDDWPAVEARILHHIRSGDHRRPISSK